MKHIKTFKLNLQLSYISAGFILCLLFAGVHAAADVSCELAKRNSICTGTQFHCLASQFLCTKEGKKVPVFIKFISKDPLSSRKIQTKDTFLKAIKVNIFNQNGELESTRILRNPPGPLSDYLDIDVSNSKRLVITNSQKTNKTIGEKEWVRSQLPKLPEGHKIRLAENAFVFSDDTKAYRNPRAVSFSKILRLADYVQKQAKQTVNKAAPQQKNIYCQYIDKWTAKYNEEDTCIGFAECIIKEESCMGYAECTITRTPISFTKTTKVKSVILCRARGSQCPPAEECTLESENSKKYAGIFKYLNHKENLQPYQQQQPSIEAEEAHLKKTIMDAIRTAEQKELPTPRRPAKEDELDSGAAQ